MSNDITAIGNSLSMELFMAYRGVLFIVGGTTYLAVKAPLLIPPALVVMSGLALSSKFIGKY